MTERTVVVVDKYENDRIDGRVRPSEERRQFVDLRRLMELGIEEH